MAQEIEKKDFFDFAIAVQKDEELYEKFFKKTEVDRGAQDLCDFFGDNGYDIPVDVCEKLIDIATTFGKDKNCDEFCKMIVGGRGY